MFRKFPNYIYKVESDCCPTTYLSSVDKVLSLVDDHCQKTGRVVGENKSAGRYRSIYCMDDKGFFSESDHELQKVIRNHTFIVEQIEVH